MTKLYLRKSCIARNLVMPHYTGCPIEKREIEHLLFFNVSDNICDNDLSNELFKSDRLKNCRGWKYNFLPSFRSRVSGSGTSMVVVDHAVCANTRA